MSQPCFLRLALPTPLRRLFDYLPPQDFDYKQLIPGVRVSVPFQSRTLIGILIEVRESCDFPIEKLKAAHAILDQHPIFTPDIFKLCTWASNYYNHALGDVLSAAMPTYLRKGKAAEIKKLAIKPQVLETSVLPLLNEYQACALSQILAKPDSFNVFLLDGVTGSGKTEVYLRAIKEALVKNKQILVLVPEISLTPQTIERFKKRFQEPVIAIHSELAEKQRLAAWLLAKNGQAKIIIGTRSAIFTPFANLGLIIIDEEHDISFKQQDRFRYHARDLAVMRAQFNDIPIVLGSATPSLESLLNVGKQRYQYLSLPNRAGQAELPSYHLIDLKQQTAEQGISNTLLQEMKIHLAAGNQVMLFLNRRGFAPVYYCSECAWIVNCKRCDARMVYHQTPARLQCHHCDSRRTLFKKCESCQQESMQPVGLGTQRLQESLEAYFPDTPIIRVDRDSTQKKGAMHALLQEIHAKPRAILLGTQMLAKGHHFPNVTLVGVIDADNGLFSADFRASEQMGQLLLQVAGRAGRADKPGKVLIQTRYPEHELLNLLIEQGYAAFAQHLLREREQALLPPFSYFALFRAEAYTEDQALTFLTKIKEQHTVVDVTLLGPVKAIMAKRKGLYAYHLLIKANQRYALQVFLKQSLQALDALPSRHQVKWIVDIDPLEVM